MMHLYTQIMKPKIVPNRIRLMGLMMILFSISAVAQVKEQIILLFDSQSEHQSIYKHFHKDELSSITYSYQSDKPYTSFDFVFYNFVLVKWVKQKGDTTFYAGRDFFEGKKCYDGAWFKQAYQNEADFMFDPNLILYLIDTRDEKDGKYRVYKVKYEPLQVVM